MTGIHTAGNSSTEKSKVSSQFRSKVMEISKKQINLNKKLLLMHLSKLFISVSIA